MPINQFQRPFVAALLHRLQQPPPFMQVLVGPRQVGKTTGIRQLMAQCGFPSHYANADDVWSGDRSWLLQQWQQARLLGEGSLLVIDEVQKIPNWSETVKALWDADPHALRVVLLGSSALRLQSGVTESLAGRFELMRIHHWRFAELQSAFGYDLDRHLVFGGYPGAVPLENDLDRWFGYMKDSIVESVIGKDILQERRVANPALFRQAFAILCAYPAQEVSYTKLLGQLQDRGNTDLIKHYIALYQDAFLMYALSKHSPKAWLSRASSPKMLPACPALYTLAAGGVSVWNADQRGRAFELAVGAELLHLPGQLHYWRELDLEVDFAYQHRDEWYAIEVKSARTRSSKGLDAFRLREPRAKSVVVTPENFGVFSQDPLAFLRRLAVR